MSIATTARMLVADPLPANSPLAIADAIQKANLWTVAAQPIVKALFTLEDAEFEVRHGCDDRTSREALAILGKPQRELRELLDGIRDDFLADQLPPQPGPDASEAEWEARDEFHDEVCRDVTTVDALIRKMEREA